MRLVIFIPRRKPPMLWTNGYLVACSRDQAERTFKAAQRLISAGPKEKVPG